MAVYTPLSTSGPTTTTSATAAKTEYVDDEAHANILTADTQPAGDTHDISYPPNPYHRRRVDTSPGDDAAKQPTELMESSRDGDSNETAHRRSMSSMWFLDADGTEHDYENRTREDGDNDYDYDFNDVAINDDYEQGYPIEDDLHYAKSAFHPKAPTTLRARIKHLAINGIWILAWFFFSISLSLYNKWMFSPGKLDFHFPILTTSYHQIIQVLLSLLTVLIVPSLRPQRDHLLSFKEYLIKIGPCALSSSGDIGLGNTSLLFISLTFYTMVKSSSLLFVLLFSFLFRLENPTLKLCMIIAVLTFGVVLMVTGETQFDLLGFLLVLCAAMFSGLRWALTHILLLNNASTKNPFTTILHLAPIMAIVLFSMGSIVEGLGNFVNAPLFAQKGMWKGLGMITAPGIFSYCMTVSEFALLKRSSVITLSVAGILKEVLTIVYSVLVFGDTLTLLNVAGLVITITSIAGYNVYRFVGGKD